MFFAPHKLYKKSQTIQRDEDGFPCASSGEWEFVGMCRCDDDNNTELMDERGNVIRASYHIVANKCSINRGDIVKVEEKDCEGQVKVLKSTNYYNYIELWI